MKNVRYIILSALTLFLFACATQSQSTTDTGSNSAVEEHSASGAMSDAPDSTYSVDSKIGDILDDPEAKEVLLSYWPPAASSQMSMARGMSLRAIAPFAGDMLNDEKLQKIDQGLRTMTVNPDADQEKAKYK